MRLLPPLVLAFSLSAPSAYAVHAGNENAPEEQCSRSVEDLRAANKEFKDITGKDMPDQPCTEAGFKELLSRLMSSDRYTEARSSFLSDAQNYIDGYVDSKNIAAGGGFKGDMKDIYAGRLASAYEGLWWAGMIGYVQKVNEYAAERRAAEADLIHSVGFDNISLGEQRNNCTKASPCYF